MIYWPVNSNINFFGFQVDKYNYILLKYLFGIKSIKPLHGSLGFSLVRLVSVIVNLKGVVEAFLFLGGSSK